MKSSNKGHKKPLLAGYLCPFHGCVAIHRVGVDIPWRRRSQEAIASRIVLVEDAMEGLIIISNLAW